MKPLLTLAVALCCLVARAQTNTTPITIPAPLNLDFLTNIPTSTNFQSATIGLGTGAMIKNGGVENYIKADYYIHTNWALSLEVQNAPSAAVVDAMTLYGGYRKAWVNTEVIAQLGGRRNWETALDIAPSWQGVALLTAAWKPMTAEPWMIECGAEVDTAAHGNVFKVNPNFTGRAGIKFIF